MIRPLGLAITLRLQDISFWRNRMAIEELDDDEIDKIVEEARRDTRYVVTDYPVELIVQKFSDKAEDEGDIYIPDYQRTLRWPDKSQAYFIESIILRVPVPPIFLYDRKGRLELVDGSQRVRTLVRFARNEFELFDLERLEILNGMKFLDLPPAVRKRLLNTPIRSFVLDEGTDESTRIELFRRLNTTGKKLHDAEIRKGAYQGRFLDLILECSASKVFLALTPRISKASDPESERQELVTRFFVYSNFYQDFRHDVRKFLDQHVIELNRRSKDKDLERMRGEFFSTMDFLYSNAHASFYRTAKSATLPRVRFEAISVGTCLALRENPELSDVDMSWVWGDELQQLVRTDASNSGPRLRDRVEFVRNQLLASELQP
jgi:Protein of unknown function DUF262